MASPVFDPETEDSYKEYLENLQAAHIHAEKALNALYKPSAPKRSIWYRMSLGRAQSLLIGLYVMELKRKGAT
jgi:hypothetical protein